MEKWKKKQELKREVQGKDDVKEALAKYCFELSKLTFTTLVLGGAITLLQNAEVTWMHIIITTFGIIITGFFLLVAVKLIK